MYAEAAIGPDLSNYYRLLHEASIRRAVEKSCPDYAGKLKRMFKTTLAQSFLQATPKKNIAASFHDRAAFTPGRIPREIEITNTITERQIMLKRLFESLLNPVPDQAATQAIELEIRDYCASLGLDDEMATTAIRAVKDFAVETLAALRPRAQPQAQADNVLTLADFRR